MSKIIINNKSRWPTPAIEVLGKWIAKRAGINHDYTIEVKSCRSQSWGGRGGRRAQRSWLDRHYRRVDFKRGVSSSGAALALECRRKQLARLIKAERADGFMQWPDRDCGDWDAKEKAEPDAFHRCDVMGGARDHDAL